MPHCGHLRMPRRVALPRLERKAGVVDVVFLLSLCFAARLAWIVRVCGVEDETTLDGEEIVASVSILGLFFVSFRDKLETLKTRENKTSKVMTGKVTHGATYY